MSETPAAPPPATEPQPAAAPETGDEPVAAAAPETSDKPVAAAAPAPEAEARPEPPAAPPRPELPEGDLGRVDGPDGRPILTIREMLEAGVHFGHQTNRWNPKMRPYIFGSRAGVHIIDLQKTLTLFVEAYRAVVETVAAGGSVLFVGTKKQAQEPIREQAERAGMFYVTNRWLGGTLTNWTTIKKSIETLRAIEKRVEDGSIERHTKKEGLRMRRRAAKLERNLGGIKDMNGLPGLLFVVDPRKERIAVAEANRLDIPIVALTDTNCDPDPIRYVIPSNDDSIRAIALFSSRIADACLLGRKLGRERAVAAREDVTGKAAQPEEIHVRSGGDGPKVEIVSRRSAPRPAPEAAATPEDKSS